MHPLPSARYEGLPRTTSIKNREVEITVVSIHISLIVNLDLFPRVRPPRPSVLLDDTDIRPGQPQIM